MLGVEVYLIPGCMVGIELPDKGSFGEDVKFSFVIDLFIVRFIFVWFKA
jgi:hypothetical protein